MTTQEAIIIFRIGSLGDTIVALPCFHLIARKFAGARRILVTDTPISERTAPVESVLGKSGLIDQVVYFPAPQHRSLGDFLKLRSQIKETGARTLVYVADRTYFSTLRDLLFFLTCGISRIYGAPMLQGKRKLRTDPATGDTEREAERLARCLEPLGTIDLADQASWDLLLQPDEVRIAQRALAPLEGCEFIALNLSTKIPQKDWGDENWTALLRRMAGRLSKFALVFVGAGNEYSRAANLAASWPGKTLNLCGKLAPRESAAAISEAQFFVGHDGGPLHLAAAMGVPCIGVYGDYNMPKWWHPMGAAHRIQHDMRGVRAIRPDDVYELVRLTASDVESAQRPRRIQAARP